MKTLVYSTNSEDPIVFATFDDEKLAQHIGQLLVIHEFVDTAVTHITTDEEHHDMSIDHVES